jgi:RNA polymerase sigma-70 factor (ECF subfamily)
MMREMKVKPLYLKARPLEISDELISRSIDGDKDALEELASRCLPRVWNAVYLTCGGGQETDDIVQNAVIDAFCGLATFRGTGSFVAWLNRIAVRAAYRHMRKRSLWSMIPFSDKLDDFPDGGFRSPDKKTEERRILDRVAVHMRAVKLKNRAPLVLAMIHGYSVVEIADAVGCNVETAKKRLQRGRLELSGRLCKDPYCMKIMEEVGL